MVVLLPIYQGMIDLYLEKEGRVGDAIDCKHSQVIRATSSFSKVLAASAKTVTK